MSEQSQGTWLTQEAYDRLAAELEHRKTTERKEIAQRVEAARQEGDLRENAGYHAAREEAAHAYSIGMSSAAARNKAMENIPEMFRSDVSINRNKEAVTVTVSVPSIVDIDVSSTAGIISEE